MKINEIRRSQIVRSTEIYRLLSDSRPSNQVTVIGDNTPIAVSWLPAESLRKDLWKRYEENNNWKIFVGNDEGVTVATATLIIEDSLDSKKTTLNVDLRFTNTA